MELIKEYSLPAIYYRRFISETNFTRDTTYRKIRLKGRLRRLGIRKKSLNYLIRFMMIRIGFTTNTLNLKKDTRLLQMN